jgi:hypothetical protein
MKKILFFLLFFCITNLLNAQSSVYHPFPIDSAVWRMDVSMTSCGGYCYTYDLKMLGDTIIGSLSYKKILGYNRALRDDPIQKKVYIYSYPYNQEYLLYDFSLSVGDTVSNWWSEMSGPFGETFVISSVDSVLINSQYRKRLTIQQSGGWFSVQIMEGIGSGQGLFMVLMPFEHYELLTCFQGDGALIYSNGSHTSCGDLLSSKEINYLQTNVAVFPNPSNGKFQIKTEVGFNQLEITDVLGKTIYKSEIKNRSAEIDLSDKLPGIYFVRLSDLEGNSVVKKIVKE